jgi:hypothetical protein
MSFAAFQATGVVIMSLSSDVTAGVPGAACQMLAETAQSRLQNRPSNAHNAKSNECLPRTPAVTSSRKTRLLVPLQRLKRLIRNPMTRREFWGAYTVVEMPSALEPGEA